MKWTAWGFDIPQGQIYFFESISFYDAFEKGWVDGILLGIDKYLLPLHLF